MKFVKSILKVWPEIMVLLSSMSYIPTISLFMMVFILLYRSKEKRIDKFEAVDAL